MAGGNVPGNLAPIFNAAGRAYGIPPAVLAGISSVESNFNFGRGEVSSTGAMGGMQFEPGTARSLGVNPWDPRSAIFGTAKYLVQLGYHQNPMRAIGAYNGGPGNPQMGYAQQVMSEAHRLGPELGGGGVFASGGFGSTSIPYTTQSFNQAAFKAANDKFIAGSYLSGLDQSPYSMGTKASDLGPNPLFGPGLLTTKAPNPQNYITTATHQLQLLAGTPLVNVHGGAKGYVNPIPGAVLGRTDMGVDASLKPGAPIRAIGDSQVLGIMPNWYQGQPYLALRLLSGPQRGRVYYVAEQIHPLVRPGEHVRGGQPIAQFAPQGTGIEIGWASPNNWQQTLAQASGNTGDASHNNAPAGVNFRSFLGGLGA